MKRRYAQIIMILLLAQTLVVSALAKCGDLDAGEMPYDGYLVKIEEGTADIICSDKIDYLAGETYWVENLQLVTEIAKECTVSCIEPNYTVSLFDGEVAGSEGAENWAHRALSLSYARSLGLSGDGVRIAIIDSGMDLENPWFANTKIDKGYDYTKNTDKMCDENGHGTSVAQIIAAAPQGEEGGIAPGVTLVPLRCFSGMSTGMDVIIKAIYEAVDDYHCDIINMSWGMEQTNEHLRDAVQHAAKKGCILVAAAGNVATGQPQGTVFYPAAYPEVIGVGSLDASGTIASSSQQTSAVFVCAPGEKIPVFSSETKTVSGTSFAAPCITASLALAREIQPKLDSTAAMELLCQRAVDCGEEGYDTVYGYGSVDIQALFEKSWYCRKSAETADIVGWMHRKGGGVAVAAAYRTSGQMLGCTLQNGERDIFGFSAFWDVPSEVRVFYLIGDTLQPYRMGEY